MLLSTVRGADVGRPPPEPEMTQRAHPRQLPAVLLMILATTLAAEGGVAAGLPLYAGEVLSSHAIEAVTVSGFGYGANLAGTRFGGFGIGFLDHTDELQLRAGFGGLIVGQEFGVGPVSLAISSWTGAGGFAWPAVADGDRFAALFEELTLELGFSPVPWLQVVAYGGYQFIASIAPRFFGTLVYTPVAGVRVVFG